MCHKVALEEFELKRAILVALSRLDARDLISKVISMTFFYFVFIISKYTKKVSDADLLLLIIFNLPINWK